MTELFNKKLNTGFTTVEFLAAVFVFSIMALVTTAIMARAMDLERRAFGAQVVQENAISVLELLAKEIRVSLIANQDNNCTATTLTITHPILGTIVYTLNAQGIIERATGGETYYVSSNEVRFNTLKFCVSGSTLPSDDKASRVTIVTSISNLIGRGVYTVNLQTTVVTRDLSDEL